MLPQTAALAQGKRAFSPNPPSKHSPPTPPSPRPQDGDVVTCEIDGIGAITNAVQKVEDPRTHPSGCLLNSL